MGSIISCITPTLNRPGKHEALYAIFSSQDWPEKRLHVLDESAEPSPFFLSCTDPSVDYVHAPIQGKREVTRIGAARNALCARAHAAGASFISWFDDDDHYASDWLSQMHSKLGDADLAKLAVFRLLVESGDAAGTLWQWDVRKMGGKHYGLRGSESPKVVEVPEGEDPVYAEAVRYGYGFSFLFRADLQRRFPFPEEGTEDYPWVRTLQENGAKIVEVDDFAHGCVHVVSKDSQSMCWPQVALSPGFGASARSMYDFVRTKMLGSVEEMYELPQGKDFMAKPGVVYSVVAKIANSHTLKSITTRAESWGLSVSGARDKVDPKDFGVKPAPNGYRLIHVMGSPREEIKIPWKTNKWIAAFDESSVVRAWADQPVGGAKVNDQLAPMAGVAGFVRKVRPRVDYQINHQLSPRSP
jgi:hypothetical protein